MSGSPTAAPTVVDGGHRGGAKFCVGFTEEDALCVASDLEAVAIVVLSAPRTSLIAALPVSLKSDTPGEGNKLSYTLSPLFTQERDPYKLLQRIIKVQSLGRQRIARHSTKMIKTSRALG